MMRRSIRDVGVLNLLNRVLLMRHVIARRTGMRSELLFGFCNEKGLGLFSVVIHIALQTDISTTIINVQSDVAIDVYVMNEESKSADDRFL